MTTFLADWEALPPERRAPDFAAVDRARVERALAADPVSAADFAALLSPAARPLLEPLARRAHAVTLQRFGRTIQLYAPIYLSNACTNRCVYCGFSAANDFERTTLDDAALLQEAAHLAAAGIRHVLLVTGEDRRAVSLDGLVRACAALRPRFASLSLEVWPLAEEGYGAVVAAGADGLTLYQETYDRAVYARMHPAGSKRDYAARLAAVEAAGRAGLRRIGIGALLGLSDWRREAVALHAHAAWLMRRFWRTQVTISTPRLRHAEGGIEPPQPVPDAALVQLLCALRVALPDAGLVISTRESAALRDRLLPLGVTHMSAGSRTSPGGYAASPHPPSGADGAQFAVEDARPPTAVAAAIRAAGYDPVWKDWDPVLSG